MTHAKRMKLLNEMILAVRPHGHLAESVLQPLQDLKQSLQDEHDDRKDEHDHPARATRKHARKDDDGSTPAPPDGPTEVADS